jgi:phospholipid/cholesterol/gamma-HCH transport system substrate-binding protein
MSKKKVWLFIATAVGTFVALVVLAAHRQGWFSPHDVFFAKFENGEGLNPGTPVSMSGLRIGRVSGVELGADNDVVATLKIQRKYSGRIKEDSKATLGRPFIIGERMISVSAGQPQASPVAPGTFIRGEESLELLDLLSGGRLSPYFNTFSKLLEQMSLIVEGGQGEDGKKTVKLMDLYKQTYSTLKTVEGFGDDMRAIRQEFATSKEMKTLVGNMSKSSDQLDNLVRQTGEALPAMTEIARQVSKTMPALNQTLAETSLTFQAMQRSFFLSGSVKDIKAEQLKRQPATSEATPSTKAPESD